MTSTANMLILQNPAVHTVINRWFDSLQQRNSDTVKRFNGRAERAELRRASPPYGALMCQGYFRLLESVLANMSLKDEQRLALALFACVAVHISSSRADHSFAAQLGKKNNSDQPYLSPLRFLRLQQVRTPEELCRQLIRAVKIRGDKGVNLVSLADDIFLWIEEWQAKEQQSPLPADPMKRLAVRWASEYFQVTQSTPADAPLPSPQPETV